MDPIAEPLAGGLFVADPDEIADYFRQHPELEELVARIAAGLRSRFGDGTELVLTYYRDPEIDDPHLTLLVRQAPYAPDLLDQIDAVRAPFDQELEQSTGMLVVTTDFCPPRGSHGV
jgi:hypothetical protein